MEPPITKSTLFLKNLAADKPRLFAYILVIFAAIIFILLPLVPAFEPAHNFLQGLTTEFIGATLLFLLVDIFFGSSATHEVSEEYRQDQHNILERLDQVRNMIDSHPDPIPQDELFSMREIIENMNSFEQVKVIGNSLENFLKDYQGVLIRRVQQGAHAQIVIVDLDSPAADLIVQHKPNFLEAGQKAVEILDQITAELKHESGPGTFKYNRVNTIPHASVMILDPHKEHGLLRLVFHGLGEFSSLGSGRLCLMIHKRDYPDWFAYYVNEFDKLWQRVEFKDNTN